MSFKSVAGGLPDDGFQHRVRLSEWLWFWLWLWIWLRANWARLWLRGLEEKWTTSYAAASRGIGLVGYGFVPRREQQRHGEEGEKGEGKAGTETLGMIMSTNPPALISISIPIPPLSPSPSSPSHPILTVFLAEALCPRPDWWTLSPFALKCVHKKAIYLLKAPRHWRVRDSGAKRT